MVATVRGPVRRCGVTYDGEREYLDAEIEEGDPTPYRPPPKPKGPQPVASNIAASGYRVDFFEKPWRHYTITPAGGEPERVVSVTQAIGIVDKSGPLQHYAATETLRGIATVALDKRGRLPNPAVWGPLAGQETRSGRIEVATGLLKESLRSRKLMFYDRTQQAIDRGLALHDIFEAWAEQQRVPVASDYPEEYRGYIRSLAGWLAEHNPEFVASEVVVGSARHRYAGRMDSVVVMRVGGRRRRIDLKTSKAVYPRSHFPQLKAYEAADVEMGHEPTDEQGILRLDGAGAPAQYVAAEGVTLDDFLALLTAHRSQHPIPESLCPSCATPTKRGKCPKGCDR